MHEQTPRKPWKMHRSRMSGTSEIGQHWCYFFVPGSPPKPAARCRECMESGLGGLREERKCQQPVWHREAFPEERGQAKEGQKGLLIAVTK